MICRYLYAHVYMRCIPYVRECVHVRMYVSSEVLIFSIEIIVLSETLKELPNGQTSSIQPFLNPQSFGLCGPGSRIQS